MELLIFVLGGYIVVIAIVLFITFMTVRVEITMLVRKEMTEAIVGVLIRIRVRTETRRVIMGIAIRRLYSEQSQFAKY